jgi:uncharacterized protein (DUF427 family)
VWDYPRPPRVEPNTRRLTVELAGVVVAASTGGFRVLETSQPPAYYLPPDDVDLALLRPTETQTLCEWKGRARYRSIVVGERVAVDAAWTYPRPAPGFEAITDHLAFFPARVDRCAVDGEEVQANEGDFYGGWITSWVVGPFKGGPGTAGW